jgi:glycosyltransferase involved in cell wall biosynthesis
MNVTVSEYSRFIKSVVLIVASEFLLDPKRIAGGINEHYVGLYGAFVRRYSKIYKILWYSAREGTLHTFDTNGNIAKSTKMPMPLAILKVLVDARKSSGSIPLFTVIIAYYYAAKDKPVSYLISLSLFHILRIMGLANVIADVIDPPVEVQDVFESPPLKKVLLGTILDIITLKKGIHMWFCSNSYQKYMTKKYRIPYHRTHVIYDGSVPELITPKPPKEKGSLTVFYSGALLSIKGVPQLVKSIEKLRKKGIEVTLLLTGGVRRPSRPHVEVDKPWGKSIFVSDWLEWTKILSEQADICVIPYPRKLHWDLTFHMKLPDYMAAGKPIVSMYGTETAHILKKYKCGLIAKNWEEFEKHITRLYQDRTLANTLGNNGRKAVEEYFNYENLAGMLHEIIQKCLRAPIPSSS